MVKNKKQYFKNIPPYPDFVSIEKEQLKNWYQKGIVKKYLLKNQNSKKKFSFLDGPITANNPMGVHHARGRTYKDLWQRYFTMKGYKGRYQNGFDCQGLWVEVEVEKELNFKSKKDIQKYGIEKFVNQCKKRVLKFSKIQTEQSKRLAMFMDWKNSYFTMSDKNNYAIWRFLKVCYQRGWLYKGHDSVPWCPRCETAISQHEILTEDYKQVTHDSIYFTLPLIDHPNQFLLVWTTTPWTIPLNIAVAIDKDFDYSLVKTKKGCQYWLAKDLVKSVLGKDYQKTIKTVKGRQLIGLKYKTVFDDLPAVEKAKNKNPKKFHTVIPTDTRIMPIVLTEGTGLVHTAVSAGSEDYKLGHKLNLPMIPGIKDNAQYTKAFGPLSGKNAKTHPDLIFKYLKTKKGHWYYQIKPYNHRYPSCWRCKTELVWKVTEEWYIAVDKPDPADKKKRTLRQQLITSAKKINWIPGFGLDRELDWLKNMHDWLISKKNRYWGLCLPIYECSKCKTVEVIGSQKELQKKAVKGWTKFKGHSPHKPWIDYVKIKCPKCGSVVSRIEPVGNPWLDAGIVSISTMSENWFPADFITESFPGQFKNWFYSLIVMAVVLKKTHPFKTVLGFESVVGEDGRPMHKSWGNAIEFNQGAEEIGVDVMRWMYCQPMPATVLSFGYKKADEIRRQFILILWNSFRYFITQANLDYFKPQKTLLTPQKASHLLDKWILTRLVEAGKIVTQSLDQYLTAPAVKELEAFVQDFSTWYIRRSRDRVAITAQDQKDKQQTYQTMYTVLIQLSKLLAPFIPYLSDYIYTSLTKQKSVHLAEWPVNLARQKINQNLLDQMKVTRELASLALAQRKLKNVPLRQPLNSLATSAPIKLTDQFSRLLIQELNVKKHSQKLTKKQMASELDFKLTSILKKEGEARNLIRAVQQKRKESRCRLDQKIILTIPDWPEEFTDYIKQKTLTEKIIKGNIVKIKKL